MILTQRLAPDLRATVQGTVNGTLALTAADRVRSRHHFHADGQSFTLQLPRGTVLQDDDLLQADTGELVRIVAKPEPVMTVTAAHPLALLRAAYHLGNRHVPLEVTATYLRLSPDSILQEMLERMEMQVTQEITPFYPEAGAYGQKQGHNHSHDHDSSHS